MEYLPTAISYGVSYDDFWELTPHTFHLITRGHLLKMQYDDRMNWLLGQYINHAVGVAIDHCFNGRKARSEYLQQPILADYIDDMYLTQEERDERQLRKMIANEEAWILQTKQHGLAETSFTNADDGVLTDD